MAIAENGPYGNHRGKLGKLVYYMLNGRNVSRHIGITNKEPTQPQLKCRMEIKLCGNLFHALLGFINTGFMADAHQAKDNAFNQAVKYNKRNIIKGIYPDLDIAYDRLLVSRGSLLPAQNCQVIPGASALRYTWDTNPEMAWLDATDQVMMLAYFPNSKKTVYKLFGSNRSTGTDILEVPEGLQKECMETYVSFISANRKIVANSIYMGSFTLENSENSIPNP